MTETIGSSDVAGILGESPWTSPWGVWSRLAGLTERDYSNSSVDTEDGNIMEPGIVARYGRERGIGVMPGPLVTEPPRIGPESWMSCHEDAMTADWVVVEAKAPRTLTEGGWGPSGSSSAPRHYIIQGLWLMLVMKSERCDLVAFGRYDRDDRFRVYPLPRRERLERAIVDRVRDWREAYVLTGTPPPVDSSNDCARALSSMHREQVTKTWREGNAIDLALANDLLATRRMLAEITDRKKLIENQLRQRIGADHGVRVGDQVIATHGVVKGRKKLDTKALRAVQPAIADQFTTVGEPSRRFAFPFDTNSEDDTNE